MKKIHLLILSVLLLTGITFSIIQIINATVPNPGHGTSALEGDGNLNMNNNKITNLATPTASSDASTMGYVNSLASAGGGITLIGESSAPACPSGWTSALTGYWTCTFGTVSPYYVGPCFCGPEDIYAASWRTLGGASMAEEGIYKTTGGTNYYYCSICVK